MLSVYYLAYIQTLWRNTYKNCPDQRTKATKLHRCVNGISGDGQTVKFTLFEGRVFNGSILCECSQRWICFQVHCLKSSNDSSPPSEGLWDSVYTVVSKLRSEFLGLKFSAWLHQLFCSSWQCSSASWESAICCKEGVLGDQHLSVCKYQVGFLSSLLPILPLSEGEQVQRRYTPQPIALPTLRMNSRPM